MINIEQRTDSSAKMVILAPILALTLTAISTMIIFLWASLDVMNAFYVFYIEPLTGKYNLSELLVKAAPLMMIALGLSIGFRAGVWNIGAEGQYIIGAISGGAVGLYYYNVEATWLIPLMAFEAVLGGMGYAGIAAFLRTRFQVNEILVTLMLTYVAILFLSAMVFGPLRNPDGFNFPESRIFHDSATLPIIWQGTRAHIGFIIALLFAGVTWFITKKHMFGMQIKISGSAPRAARFAGFNENKTIWYTLLISGGLAGLAGLFEAAGPVGELVPHLPVGYGFTAIIVAFLARLHPIGIVFTSLLIALTYMGGENAQITLQLPSSITSVFQGMLLFYFLACNVLIEHKVAFSFNWSK